MEETKMLQQIMRHMDDLLRGTDPVSGEALSEDSVLLREDLVRCFRYVSRTIRRELGDTDEICQEAESQKPAELSAFMEETARSLGMTGYSNFLPSAARGWLRWEGYLARGRNEDGAARTPADSVTPKGAGIGLSQSEQDEKGKPVILCDSRAQDLLRKRVDLILAWERTQWEPLFRTLTAEWRSHIACSAGPRALLPIVKQINSRLPKDLPRHFNGQRVNLWMMRNGFLEYCYNNTKRYFCPTWKGKEIGLVLEKKYIYWTTAAQQFLLDHLETIAQDMASGDAYRIPAVLDQLKNVEEVRAHMQYSARELSVYDLEVRINRALIWAKSGACRLPHGVLLGWLRQKGFCDMQAQRGFMKKVLIVTASGHEAGFRMEKGLVRIDEAAQHFVLNELEDIWAFYYRLEHGE